MTEQTMRDLIRQMLALHFDDSTILCCLGSANIQNGQDLLEDVLDENKRKVIVHLRVP